MGGVCQAVKTIVNALTPFGVINEIVSLDAPNEIYLKNNPFVIYAVGKGKGPWKYNPELKNWLSTHLVFYDIVIVHGLWLYTGYIVRKTLENLTSGHRPIPKFLVMPHGMLDPYFQLTEGRKIKAIRNRIFWNLIENKLITSADALLFTCETELELASKTFKPYHPKATVLVGLGVEQPPEYNSRMKDEFNNKLNFKDGQPYLLFLGRLQDKKGIDLLITAYRSLNKSDNNLPSLVIAGPGIETAYGKYLQQLAEGANNIYFTNMLMGDAKWGAFYGCEAFVLTSHQENFGIAIVEAMACSKPVLISRQINIFKEIEQDAAGLICNDSLIDIEIMLKKWILFSTDKKQTMAIAALNCFKKNYAMEVFSKKMYTLISSF